MAALPTLRQMQFLTALARQRSFSRAAEVCFVSQSTLSAGIKEMETILGGALVDRTNRAFALTPVGEEVTQRAEEVLTLAQEMVRVAEARAPLTGELRVGLIPTIAPFLLPRLVPLLTERYPDLHLTLCEEITERLLDALRAGRLDMAVLALPVEGADAAGGLETACFADDPFVLLVRPDHPLAREETVGNAELTKERLLLLEDGHCLRDHALAACRLRDRDVADAFGATSLYTLAQLVRAGAGVTLAPRLAIEQGLAASADLTVVPVRERGGEPSRRLGLAWRRGSGREAEADALLTVLRDAAQAPAIADSPSA